MKRMSDHLHILEYWIEAEAKRLMVEHGGLGCVAVFLNDRLGFDFHWDSTGEMPAQKAHFKKLGLSILFVHEALELIRERERMISTERLWEAVVWMAKYGRSPNLNYTQYLSDDQWPRYGKTGNGDEPEDAFSNENEAGASA